MQTIHGLLAWKNSCRVWFKGKSKSMGDPIYALGVKPEDVWATGRYRHIVEARSLLCYWAVRELGIIMSSLARKLKISVPAVSKSVLRGEKLAKAGKYALIE